MSSPVADARRGRPWPFCGGVYVLVTQNLSVRPLAETIEACARGGATAIQLREKGLEHDEWLERARVAREITRRHEIALVINDSPRIAVACEADGVHLGLEDAPIEAVREDVGPDMSIGASCHSMADVRRAVAAGADSLGLGPIFPTSTKSIERTVGTELIRLARAHTDRPCFPIGGIDAANIDEVAAAGATGVAVCRAVIGDPDIEGAVRALRERLDAGRVRS